MPARDDLGFRHRGYTEFGALHRIAPTKEVFKFFAEATQVADEIFKERHQPLQNVDDDLGLMLEIEGIDVSDESPEVAEPEDKSWYNQDEYYRIYDHSTVWVGVLEANATRKKAHAARRVLQANDAGLMKQETRDNSSRIYPNTPMGLLFDTVTLVGHKQANGNARGMQTHIALVPSLEHYHDTSIKLFMEYDIITSFLRRYYGQSFLSDKYTPHAEFMTFRKQADHGDIGATVAGLKDVLAKSPLHVTLKELEFPEPRSSRTRRK
jgi:hypothetical protein